MAKNHETKINNIMLFHRIGAVILGILILLTALFFQDCPFNNIGSPDSPAPHWGIILNAFFNQNFLREIWFGVNLPSAPFTGERIIATSLGSLIVATLFFLGRFIFIPFKKSLATTNCETLFFSGALGYVFLSFTIQVAGLLGHGAFPILPQILTVFIIGLAFTLVSVIKNRNTRTSLKLKDTNIAPSGYRSSILLLQTLLIIVFTSFYVFSASQPVFEYDALEYHAQGAREIYENGAILFSHYNVYSNMPLGAEMFYVAGLNMARDVAFQGADTLRLGLLIGKTILTGSSLLVAFGLACFCIRFFKSTEGALWGAIIYLSFPNLFSVYSNGLNEGVLAMAIFCTCYVLLLTAKESLHNNNLNTLANITALGIFAGFAASIKYTGIIFVFIPAFFSVAALLLRPSSLRFAADAEANNNSAVPSPRRPKFLITLISLTTFILVGTVVCGGWYIKNYVATGNPVYPLAFDIFGDKTNEWNESINARWQKAHSPSGFGPEELGDAIARSFWQDDFNSPLYIFVPFVGVMVFFGILHTRTTTIRQLQIKRLFFLFALTTFFWIAWFLLTHRLTRFLLPVSPLMAILLAMGVSNVFKSRSLVLKSTVLSTLLFSLFYSGLLVDMIGQGRLAPLRSLENDPDRFPAVAIYFNNHSELLYTDLGESRPSKKILLVGDAKACAYRVPVLYSTCWNNSPLVQLLDGGVNRNNNGTITEIRDPSIIKTALKNAGVAYISVDFGELSRFRSEGNYGFNNSEINANLFLMLMQANIIEPFSPSELSAITDSIQVFRVKTP